MKYPGVGPLATPIAVVVLVVTLGVVLGPAWGDAGFLVFALGTGLLVATSAVSERVRYARFRNGAVETLVARVIERSPSREPGRHSASRGLFFPRARVEVEHVGRAEGGSAGDDHGRRRVFCCDWEDWRRLPPGSTRRLVIRGDVICGVDTPAVACPTLPPAASVGRDVRDGSDDG